jgi:hypothetical protein
MPREAKPWFNKHTGWRCTDITGKRLKLVRGEPLDATKDADPGRVGQLPRGDEAARAGPTR